MARKDYCCSFHSNLCRSWMEISLYDLSGSVDFEHHTAHPYTNLTDYVKSHTPDRHGAQAWPAFTSSKFPEIHRKTPEFVKRGRRKQLAMASHDIFIDRSLDNITLKESCACDCGVWSPCSFGGSFPLGVHSSAEFLLLV